MTVPLKDDMGQIFQDVLLDTGAVASAVTVNSVEAVAIISFDKKTVEDYEDGRGLEQSGKATFSIDALGFTPEIGQRILINSTIYAIYHVEGPYPSGRLIVQFKRKDSIDRGGPNYGIRR